MLSKRNLYPSLSTKLAQKGIKFRMDIISYSDGQNSLIDIANLLDRSIEEVYAQAKVLQELRIITFQ
jgi:aminopeptidase-like protein